MFHARQRFESWLQARRSGMDFQPSDTLLTQATSAASAHDTEDRMSSALGCIESTLLIPLAARALGDRLFPNMAVSDSDAATALAGLNVEVEDFLQDHLSVYGVLARTHILRELAQDFFNHNPRGWAVNLGCGLSSYFQWLDRGRNQWIDADLPAVINLREHLVPGQGQRHRDAVVDLRQPHWWRALGLPQGPHAPAVLVMLEGVLMYLQPQQVRDVMHEFAQHAPAGSQLIFDSLSWMAVGQARLHPSVSRTQAEFLWGARSMSDFTANDPRLRLLSEHPILDGYDASWACLCPLFRALWGVPLYAVIRIGLRDDPPASALDHRPEDS
jgi:O-methyltransferase involved in polyketide biosynthesis